MNTLVDTITQRRDLGYQFTNSPRKVNILQYADDTCIVANCPASCQHLLSRVSDWLKWSGMTAKVPKCQCIALQSSTGKLVDPHLTLNGNTIPFTTQAVRFLGMQVQVPTNSNSARQVIISRLQGMLTAIDETPLTRKQKLLLYSGGVCPRMTWPLLIQEFPATWMEQEVDSLVTRYLKKWSGLGRPGNTALLHLPRAKGGLNLPCLSSLHRKLQVSRQCQLRMSQDSCVRFLADRNLQQELRLTRKRFRPAGIARDTLATNTGTTKKTIIRSAKAVVMDDINTSLLDNLHSLERQGQLSRSTRPECALPWARAVQSLPEEQMKFALNAAVDVLPHNANQHLWRKKNTPSCPLCGGYQTLLHVLNNCSVARDSRRYNIRHDAVLNAIATAVSSNIPSTTTLTVDTGDNYSFPLHIVPTNLRPDMVWWDDTHKSLCLAELTVCFETNFEQAALRKSAKYLDLLQQAQAGGYDTTLITLQVGSRGVPDLPGFETLATVLAMTAKDLTKLLQSVAREALTGSFRIWCSRNRQT